jgi:hypothetical protein
MFWKRTIWIILGSVLFLGLLAAGGVAIYYAGYTHGALATSVEAGGEVSLPALPAPFDLHQRANYLNRGHSPFMGLFCGGFLLLLFFFMIGGFFRRWAWNYGPGWRHPRYHGWGPPPPYWKDMPDKEPSTEKPPSEDN